MEILPCWFSFILTIILTVFIRVDTERNHLQSLLLSPLHGYSAIIVFMSNTLLIVDGRMTQKFLPMKKKIKFNFLALTHSSTDRQWGGIFDTALLAISPSVAIIRIKISILPLCICQGVFFSFPYRFSTPQTELRYYSMYECLPRAVETRRALVVVDWFRIVQTIVKTAWRY